MAKDRGEHHLICDGTVGRAAVRGAWAAFDTTADVTVTVQDSLGKPVRF